MCVAQDNKSATETERVSWKADLNNSGRRVTNKEWKTAPKVRRARGACGSRVSDVCVEVRVDFRPASGARQASSGKCGSNKTVGLDLMGLICSRMDSQ